MAEQASETAIRSELQDLVLESTEFGEFLNGFVNVAARELSEHTGRTIYSAVTLLRPKHAGTVASSSEEAQNMDEIQYGFDDGPCLRAARGHTTVLVQDFEAEHRFGNYTKAVIAHGIRSALGVPIIVEGAVDAGLDLYCREPGVFDPATIAEAEKFAVQASRSLRLAVRISALEELSNHLSAAMENRTTIDLAVGIIMGQNRCSQETAVNILKAASSARNIKLHAVAAAVVASVGETEPATHFQA
ncbi:ANTAR domain-containing protein [Arthrobacter sp. JZ12]|uniref:GAF and ANTAR domain-containing protein n=1 Tax=Arthrobacter sp. JZ12 TaxID=2654190 RepID=UPI002B47238C|nr:GAF and ANTAR domain-containing protein [Arthrobacter sp. JZ12]WRH24276.1 ANTAR domain-containing protein [Arthrobacter sp. JZ12]